MDARLENVDVLRRSMRAIAGLIEEGTFVFDDEGLRLRATDPSKIAMVDYFLPKHAFTVYSINERTEICIPIKDLWKVFKKAKSEEVSLSFEENKLEIHLHGKAHRIFKIPALEPVEANLPTPAYPPTAKIATIKLTGEILRTAVEDASNFSQNIKIEVIPPERRVEMSAEGTLGEYSISLTAGVDDALLDFHTADSEEIKANYSLEFLKEFLSVVTATQPVQLRFYTDSPLSVSYDIGDAVIRYYLAPRIE